MQTVYDVVIADTSCFILLDKIGELKLLQSLFGQVTTTDVIAAEYGRRLPAWVIVKPVTNAYLRLTLDIDAGEASAIALALEYGRPLLILDDDKARKAARKLNLTLTGSLGIFLKAKQSGIVTSIKPFIEKVQQKNFRYSNKVLGEILSLAGE
ncbi:MAG TPA: DUF3368 domain-containing protein [Mucilaginibacter sp.]|nr:DUF3368 domain-containing protein [Mucilaginibacter sp.]